MDPPAMSAFRSDNATTPYSLTEIWPFQFGQFSDNPTREDDPMGVEQRGEKKRRNDDVSTSTAPNVMVLLHFMYIYTYKCVL